MSNHKVVFCPYVRPEDPSSYQKANWRKRTIPKGSRDYFLPTNCSPLTGKSYQEMWEIECGTYSPLNREGQVGD